MNRSKIIVYVLAVVVMFVLPFFSNKLGMASLLLSYTSGVGIGYVIWKKNTSKGTNL
jgi:uncharacterized membrane protein YdfJ with MMPL/SSD domain